MLIAFNKPYGVLCQFSDRGTPDQRRPPRCTLAEFGLPAGVYPAGRLDFDSEGLLLLTDDGALAHRLTDPRHKQPKTYRVQVEGDPQPVQLVALRDGVMLRDGPDPSGAGAPARPHAGAVAARPAGAVSQVGGGCLDRTHPPRRPQSSGAADDRRGGTADVAVGADGDRRAPARCTDPGPMAPD